MIPITAGFTSKDIKGGTANILLWSTRVSTPHIYIFSFLSFLSIISMFSSFPHFLLFILHCPLIPSSMFFFLFSQECMRRWWSGCKNLVLVSVVWRGSFPPGPKRKDSKEMKTDRKSESLFPQQKNKVNFHILCVSGWGFFYSFTEAAWESLQMYWLWNWERVRIHFHHSFYKSSLCQTFSLLSPIANPYHGGGHLQNRWYSRKFVLPWASSSARYLLWEQLQWEKMSTTTSCPSIFLSWRYIEWVNAQDATQLTSATTIMDGGLVAVVSPSRESI